MKTLLSTKILTSNQRQLLVDAGFDVIEKEMIVIQPVSIPTFEPQQKLLFTSQQAVKSVVEQQLVLQPEKHSVFCVGEKTRKALEDSGFTVRTSFETAAALATYLLESEATDFDFFCGNRRLDTLPNKLISNGKKLREIVVYKTVNQSEKMETPLHGILFFSPSGVESFLEKNTLDDLPCFCIGPTTAAALNGITQNVYKASTPTVEATLQLSIDYFKR